MRPLGSPKRLEARRLKAVELVQQGMSYTEVAKQLRCYVSSVSRWMEVVREKGVDGLRAKQQPGRPPKLARKKRPRLEEILLKGPMAYGYPDQLWTLKRIAKVIQQEFGVEYHFCNVWKLLRTMGWSCQKPERVAREQDQRAVADWRNKEWSRIQQQAKRGKKDAGLPRRKRLHAAAAGPQDLV